MGTTDSSAANSAVKNMTNRTDLPADAGAGFFNSPLSGSVGFGGDNFPDDVHTVSTALVANDRLDEPTFDATDAFNSKIITAQQDMADGLKPDAEIKRNGPTIQKLGQVTGARDAAKRRKERRETPHSASSQKSSQSVLQKTLDALDQVKHDATRWHFEDRDAKKNRFPIQCVARTAPGSKCIPNGKMSIIKTMWANLRLSMLTPMGAKLFMTGILARS